MLNRFAICPLSFHHFAREKGSARSLSNRDAHPFASPLTSLRYHMNEPGPIHTQPSRSTRFLRRDREEKKTEKGTMTPSIWRTNKIERSVDLTWLLFHIRSRKTGIICGGERRNGYDNGSSILNSSRRSKERHYTSSNLPHLDGLI